MDFDRRRQRALTGDTATQGVAVPGKQTLTERLPALLAEPAELVPTAHASAPVPPLDSPRPTLQMLFGDRGVGGDPSQVHAAAARGTATASTQLPHLPQIQHSFGRHDISGVKAHLGNEAAESAKAIGAQAYAMGDHVVLGSTGDLHTTAHEAAHVVQQRSGVKLKGGVGEAGDLYEQHADQVANLVVQGKSAESLLDVGRDPGVPVNGSVQRKTSIVDDRNDAINHAVPGTGTGLLKNSTGVILDRKDAVFGPLRDGCGTHMEVWFDTNNFDAHGTEPKAGTWPDWWAAAAPKPNNYWVRGHLLSQNLGGPGERRNLTPLTKTANAEHHNNVEKLLKLVAAKGGARIGYRVTAEYGDAGPRLRGDSHDPNTSVWNKLALGLRCECQIVYSDSDRQAISFWVENRR